VTASFFATARLHRGDQARLVLLLDVGKMLHLCDSKVSAPVIAYASVLCGLFPEGIRIGPRGVTAPQVLEAERRLIARALQRRPQPRRTSI
jgi:hypothetical protein